MVNEDYLQCGSDGPRLAHESIQWNLACEVQPDEGILVLINAPQASEPVWPGWIEGDQWRWADGSQCEHDVKAWAEMPGGWK